MIGAQRILVRAPNWTGDLVMATPAFRALRAAYPSAELVLHVREALAPLLAGAPWFDSLLPIASHRRGIAALLAEARSLRARRFDVGLCLPDSFSSALLMRCAGVRTAVGYRTQGRGALLHLAVEPPRGLVARERHVLGLTAALGCPPRGTHLELFTTTREEETVQRLLAERGVGEDEPLAVLAPGASYGSAKRWPTESFARVGDACAAQGARVAISAAPDEAALSRSVAAAMRAPALDLVGRLDLGATKALVRRARVVVCNDAGARHLAVAFGVPAVVLFGPTSLAKTDMNLDRVRALAADVACRPCYRRECPIDHRCMTRIEPDPVIDAALPALRGDAFRGDGTLRVAGTLQGGAA
jgi:heptosyltransferase-2